MATIEVKGVTYTLCTGAKGGQYYINDKGRKVYVKATTTKVNKSVTKPVKKSGLIKKRYTALMERYNDDGELVDDFKEWHDCYSADEAQSYFEGEHPKCKVTLVSWDLV